MDYTIALKHQIEDYEYEDSKFDALQKIIRPLGEALGIEYKEPNDSKVIPQDLPVDVVLGMLGGKGVKVVKHGQG